MFSSSAKEIEEINDAHITCLMYRLLTNGKTSDDLSFAFHWDFETLEQGLASDKTT